MLLLWLESRDCNVSEMLIPVGLYRESQVTYRPSATSVSVFMETNSLPRKYLLDVLMPCPSMLLPAADI